MYSIDIDSPGKRVATAGSDTKVKVWNLVPLLSARAEEDEAQFPKLLATLTDHCAPVNTVRQVHSLLTSATILNCISVARCN